MNLTINTLPLVVVSDHALPMEVNSMSTGLSAAAASYRLVPSASLDVGKWVSILGYRFEIGAGRQLKNQGRTQLWLPAQNWAMNFVRAWQAHPLLSLSWKAEHDHTTNEVILTALNNSPYTELVHDLGPNPMLDSISQETGGQAAWELEEPLQVLLNVACTYQRWYSPLDMTAVQAMPSGLLGKLSTHAIQQGRLSIDAQVLTQALHQSSGPALPTEWGLHTAKGPWARMTINSSLSAQLPAEETELVLAEQEVLVRPGSTYGAHEPAAYYTPVLGQPATSWPMPERVMLMGLPAVELQWCQHLPSLQDQEIQQVQVWGALYYKHQLAPEWVLLADRSADDLLTGLATYGGFALDFGWPLAQIQFVKLQVRLVDIQGNTIITVNTGTHYQLHDPGAGVWHTLAFLNELGGTETLHFRQEGAELVSWVYPGCYLPVLEACLHAEKKFVLVHGPESLIENSWQWKPATWSQGHLHALPTGEWQVTFQSNSL